MTIPEFCPSCGAIMGKVPMNIQGTIDDFWVCPEGDWEEPVYPNTVAAVEPGEES
jgi:hypothetical protein